MAYIPKRVKLVCRNSSCNKEFIGKKTQKYCSHSCADKTRKEQLDKLVESRRKCPNCGFILIPLSKRRKRKINPHVQS
jgi:hypothetical protein